MRSFATSRSFCCCWSANNGTPSSSGISFRENLLYPAGSLYRTTCSDLSDGKKKFIRRGEISRLVVRSAQQQGRSNADDMANTVRALQSRNRFPKKWLGQHYMVNETVNTRIVEAAQIQPDDLVLEIGCGTGSLTRALVDAGARVITVEKDPDMASLVMERFQDSGQVQVVQLDFMKWPVGSAMRKLLAQEGIRVPSPEGRLAKLVSNLPFNITTNVIKRVVPMGDVFSRVVLLLQDEAALRLTNAAPAPVDYRPMTILVNFFSFPEYKFQVPRKAFFPEPRVDGGVVSFDVKPVADYPPVGDPNGFISMINSAFNGKRKMLRNSLQHMFKASHIKAALVSGGFPETARPEELTLEDFVEFYNAARSMAASASDLTTVVDDWVPS